VHERAVPVVRPEPASYEQPLHEQLQRLVEANRRAFFSQRSPLKTRTHLG